MTRLPTTAVYVLFAAALVAATSPVWRWWLYGLDPSLDELLQLRCFGL